MTWIQQEKRCKDITFANKIKSRLRTYVKKYYCELFFLTVFIYLAFYQIYYSYFISVCITPDSANYLLEAEAILEGYGFNQTGMAGYKTWFSAWPVGYPVLIAAMAILTGKNVYLSSKILSVLLVGFCLTVLYLRFKKDAWIYGFIFFNYGFLTIFCFTWSENPFFLGILIFTLALSEIVSADEPSKRWYVYMGISSVFSFLFRYYGTVTVIITLAVAAVYGFQCFILKKQETWRKKKLARILYTQVGAAISIGAYYLMNKITYGYMSGVERSVFIDDVNSLKANLYDALRREFFNAFRFEMPLTVANLSSDEQAVFILLGIGILFYLMLRLLKKKADYKFIFILTGILYDAVFIVIRFHSTMDEFNFRFFAPASMLITIGLLGYIQEKIKQETQMKICMVCTAATIILSASLLTNIRKSDFRDTAYRNYVKTIEYELHEVPKKSVILNYDGDYCAKYIRPDILFEEKVFQPEQIGQTDTMQDLFDRYRNSDYICIKSNAARDIIENSSGYDRSVRNFFRNLLPKETEDDAYIVISVKERCVYDINRNNN